MADEVVGVALDPGAAFTPSLDEVAPGVVVEVDLEDIGTVDPREDVAAPVLEDPPLVGEHELAAGRLDDPLDPRQTVAALFVDEVGPVAAGVLDEIEEPLSEGLPAQGRHPQEVVAGPAGGVEVDLVGDSSSQEQGAVVSARRLPTSSTIRV